MTEDTSPIDRTRGDKARPTFATMATVLFGIASMNDVLGFATLWSRPLSWLDVGYSTLSLALAIGVAIGLYTGREWSRSLALVLAALGGAYASVGVLFVAAEPRLLLLVGTRLCASIAVCVLLMRADVAEWYRRPKPTAR